MKHASRKNFIASVFALILSVAALCTLVFYGCETFGWFTTDNTPDTDALELAVTTERNVTVSFREYTPGMDDTAGWSTEADLSFPDMLPGAPYAKTVQLKFKNNEPGALRLSLSLNASANGESMEEPMIQNGNYYYLGSQIKISALSVPDTAPEPPESVLCGLGKFLVTAPLSENGRQPSFVTEALPVGRLSVAEGLHLPANAETVLQITFLFQDNGESSQNPYQTFTGVCNRQFFVVIT